MASESYEHVSPNVKCTMGNKTWSVVRQNPNFTLKTCDSCGNPIRIAKVMDMTLVNAAKTFSSGHVPLPPPMTHPSFPTGTQSPPSSPNPGILNS